MITDVLDRTECNAAFRVKGLTYPYRCAAPAKHADIHVHIGQCEAWPRQPDLSVGWELEGVEWAAPAYCPN